MNPEDEFPSPSVVHLSIVLTEAITYSDGGGPTLGGLKVKTPPPNSHVSYILLNVFSFSFIFLISDIDFCYLSKYGAFKKSSLFKKCSWPELTALLSYLLVPTSRGERAAAWSHIGKHIFFNQGRVVFPHIGQGLSPGTAENLIIFHLRHHISEFFP